MPTEVGVIAASKSPNRDNSVTDLCAEVLALKKERSPSHLQHK